jgi:hypothetical protein
VNNVTTRASLLHQLAGEGEGVIGDELDAASAGTNSGGADYVVEAAHFCLDVVDAARGRELLVVRAPSDGDVSLGGGVTAGGIKGDVVGGENPGVVENSGVAVEFVDGAVFLLLLRANGGFVLGLRGGFRRGGAGGQ